MSKEMELRILSGCRSIDAPVNFHHRTGDSEGSAGNMLDVYAQAESVEDVFFGEREERAKALFLKGVKTYLKNVFGRAERDFLRAVMDDKKTLQAIGKEMGVDWFTYLRSIQQKAYKNLEPLQTLAEKTGWSGAEAYVKAFLKRLETTTEKQPTKQERAKIREELKAVRAKNAEEKRNEKNAEQALYYTKTQKKEKTVVNVELRREKAKLWRDSNAEKLQAYREKQKAKRAELQKQQRAGALTIEEEHALIVQQLKEARAQDVVDRVYVEQLRQREYHLRNRVRLLEYRKKYNDSHKEERAKYKREHRNEINSYERARREAQKALKSNM